MQLPSPEVLATWPAPDYENPERRGNSVIIIAAIFFPLALFVLLIRIYTRIRISKSFGLDDWLIVAAMFPATAFAIAALLAETKLQWDRHIWDVPVSHVTFGLQFVMITQIIFTLAQTLTKCSMLALIYRIMSNGPRFKKATIAAVIMIAVQGMIFIIVVIFQCRPPSHFWKLSFAPQPECIDQTVHVTFAGSVNTITDCVVVLFPVPTMLRLQLPRRQRIIVVLLFAAGLLVCVAGAVRTYYTWVEISGPDATWNSYYVWVTSCIELYVGIIGASIPAAKPFFKRYIPRLLDSNIITSRSNARYVISEADKGPFSNTNTTISRPPSQIDVELGTISSASGRRNSKRLERNLDAIAETGADGRGSDSSISSFVTVRNGDDERGSRSADRGRDDGTIDMGSRGSKEDLIVEVRAEGSDMVAWKTNYSQLSHYPPNTR